MKGSTALAASIGRMLGMWMLQQLQVQKSVRCRFDAGLERGKKGTRGQWPYEGCEAAAEVEMRHRTCTSSTVLI